MGQLDEFGLVRPIKSWTSRTSRIVGLIGLFFRITQIHQLKPWAIGEEVANIAFGIVHWALDALPFNVGVDIGAGMG